MGHFVGKLTRRRMCSFLTEILHIRFSIFSSTSSPAFFDSHVRNLSVHGVTGADARLFHRQPTFASLGGEKGTRAAQVDVLHEQRVP